MALAMLPVRLSLFVTFFLLVVHFSPISCVKLYVDGTNPAAYLKRIEVKQALTGEGKRSANAVKATVARDFASLEKSVSAMTKYVKGIRRPTQFPQYRNLEYFFVQRTWYEALLICQHRRGVLFAPANHREFVWLKILMACVMRRRHGWHLWTGIHDHVKEGHWRRVSDDKRPPLFWDARCPSRTPGRNCVASAIPSGRYVDTFCWERRSFVCRYF